MNSRDIYLIEQSLDKLENTDEKQLSERLAKFFKSVCNALDLAYDAQADRDARDTCAVLFHRRNSLRKKNFIAVCLLRLLCRNDGAIWDHKDFSKRTFSLFDDQINSIYLRFNITQNHQNHKKLEKLLGCEEAVLANFRNITDSMTSLDTITGVREKYMSTLNSDLSNLFFEQFVNPTLLVNKESINQIFVKAQSYHESPMEDRVGAYQELKGVLDPVLDDAKKYPSIFSKHCIVAPVEKIYDSIRKDFESNEATKPTSVDISPLDRKYPFHEKKRKIELKFQVTNSGPGYAFDLQIECEEIEGLAPCNPVNLGTLPPKHSSVIVLQTIVETETEEKPIVMGTLSWWNFDKSHQKRDDFIYYLTPQPANLDWDMLKLQQPYSLEAINKAKDLVGRTRLMAQLDARLSADRIESSLIHGQKRVGKTSIAEVVQANFEYNPNYSAVLIPITGLDTTTSQSFIAALGKRIVRLVSRTSKSIETSIEQPTFEGALSPLVEYFEDAKDILPNHRFIIILDEFDEISPEMVQVGNNAGQAFFNNIRAISSTGYVGFVLVGGENMQLIIESTDQLNRMTSYRVDYFDKGTYWDDFQELVKRPVKGTIEFNDDAINALYEMTEGHPFYTKAICSEIYTTTCEDRNAYITEDNVQKAVQVTIEALDLNAVSHFWIDGINKRYDHAQSDDIQTQRRKFLIAFAQTKRRKESVTKQDLRNSNLLRDVDVDRVIENYINRGFLIEEADHYRWKPRFFERWLIERGFSMLTGDFLNELEIIRLKQEEEKAYVSDSEIVGLCENWELYRDAPITPPHVRAWLEQFEYNVEQRQIFTLLKHVNYFGRFRIRQNIRDLHEEVQGIIARSGASRPWDGRQARPDILLSSFGSPAQSGSSYARMYSKDHNIFSGNVKSFKDIPEALSKNHQIKALVFVDDIIASGDSVREYLNELNGLCGELIRDKQLMVLICAVCGLRLGIENVKDAAEDASLSAQVRVVVSDILDETDRCFSNQSEIFNSPEERHQARDIATGYGRNLVRNAPLGYNDSQLLVVFYDNCPNNTLPILWKESTAKPKWKPLFKRN